MGVSVKCQYAFMALLELAKRQGQGIIPLQTLAQSQNIPARFLENILNGLRQYGLVDSHRGRRGGFVLARPASEISFLDIFNAVDGIVYCVEPVRGACVNSDYELLEPLWQQMGEALRVVLQGRTLQDLCNDWAEQQLQRAADYVI